MRRWLLCWMLALCLCVPLGVLAEAVPEVVPLDEEGNPVADEKGGVFSLGDEGEEVLSIQTRLAELCYYDGSLTGHFGEATKDALKRFQADFGLEESGSADGETRAVLMDASWRPLKYGSEGEDVKRLQVRLANLGYFTGKISGRYLDSTQMAVQAFQQKMGLETTGRADVDTQDTLFSGEARTRNQSALAAASVAPTNTADDGQAKTVLFEKRLAKGSSGELVKKVQQRLADLCYYAGPVSGSYQAKTQDAVKRFQAQNGLGADGVVGEMTWNMLFNTDGVVPPDASAAPTVTPTPVPTPAYYILVDVTNQVTTVYGKDENGDYTVVVRQMLCSTGTKSNPSDVGEWTLSGRKALWCKFPKWGSHARYWTKINASIAFHSVIYNTVNLMDMSVSSYNNLGKRASHGCIRLTVADAKWIYDNVGAGTVVSIQEGLKADPELRASLKLPDLNRKTMTPYSTPQPTAEPTYLSGAKPPMPLQPLKKNDSSEAVYWMQKKLTELGYYTGKCSGTYLDGTVEAVKAFQREHNLQVTGKATVATLEKLYRDELATPAPSLTPTPTSYPTLSPTPAP